MHEIKNVTSFSLEFAYVHLILLVYPLNHQGLQLRPREQMADNHSTREFQSG